MIRVLLESYSAATRSSYGIVTREVWSRLAKTGNFEIIQHGWLHAYPAEQVPWQIIPTNCPFGVEQPDIKQDLGDRYGVNSFNDVVESVKPDIVWLLSDPWHCPVIANDKGKYGYKLLHYCPVDAEPYPPGYGILLSKADSIVTMTNFGKRTLLRIPGFSEKHVGVIPHGVDLTMFAPASKEEKAELRKSAAGDKYDKFILGWVGKDQYRKQIWQLFEVMFHIRHGTWIKCHNCGQIIPKEFDANTREIRKPSENITYPSNYNYLSCVHCGSKNIENGTPRKDIVLWTHMTNRPDTGYDLNGLRMIYDVGDSIVTPAFVKDDRGVPTNVVASIYRCMDALLFISGGEGFGLPVLEAMACGVPSIYSNYSGHAEFAVGLPVPVRLFPEVKTLRFRALVDIGATIAAIIEMKENSNLRSILSKRAIKVASGMSWDAFTNDWLDTIERLNTNQRFVSIGKVI